MTNKEWLEKVKKEEPSIDLEKDYWTQRQVKALEIIAEELIKLNERFISITGWDENAEDDSIRVRLKGTN